MRFLLLLLLSFFNLTWWVSSSDINEFKTKLEAAKLKTEEIIHGIGEKWHIKEFPNFLKSVAMSHTGWEVLKVSISV